MRSRSGLLESGLSHCDGASVESDGPMSDNAPDDADDIERELLRCAVTLRQIADCAEHMPLAQLGDFVHLRRVFNRPFGE